jgi:O-acetyl-ADP-ribose deacetylase (regulator of RNase III)
MTRLTAVQADITTLDVDAIVNAANNELAPGGGVCGAIHQAAGPALADACRQAGPCPTGEARITPGFGLKAKFVIHAVGPRWMGGRRGEAELLAGAYRSALQLAKDQGLATIAFPAISTGIYGYPLEEATAVAVRTVRESTATPSSLTDVIFTCFDERTLQLYLRNGVAG